VIEVKPGKKGEVGGRCFEIWFYFLLSYSDLIGDKFNSLFSPCSGSDKTNSISGNIFLFYQNLFSFEGDLWSLLQLTALSLCS